MNAPLLQQDGSVRNSLHGHARKRVIAKSGFDIGRPSVRPDEDGDASTAGSLRSVMKPGARIRPMPGAASLIEAQEPRAT
jgi:hypothetical protein